MYVLALVLNFLYVFAAFIIISSKRVPDLKNHPIGAYLLRLAVAWGLAVMCARLFSVPIVIFRKPLDAEDVIRFGVPAGIGCFLLAFFYFFIQHTLIWLKKEK